MAKNVPSWLQRWNAAVKAALGVRELITQQHNSSQPPSEEDRKRLKISIARCDSKIGAFDSCWRHCEDKEPLWQIREKIHAALPVTTYENGIEVVSQRLTVPDKTHPDYSSQAISWERADRFQQYLAQVLPEIEYLLNGKLPSAAEEWGDLIAKIRGANIKYRGAPPVTMGAKSLSREHYATEALRLSDEISDHVERTITIYAQKGEQDALREYLSEILIRSVHLGVFTRAAFGKSIELDALRGRKTLYSSALGGKAKAQQTRPGSSEVIKEMEALIEKHGHSVRNAARLTAAKQIGTSFSANRKLWERNRKLNK